MAFENRDIQFVKGVGEARVKTLNRLGIYNLEDLITYYPRGYEDRSEAKKICEIADGEEALIKANVVIGMQIIRPKTKKITICKILVRDDTDVCEITWYNQPYLKDNFKVGNEYSFFGKVTKKARTCSNGISCI